MEQKIKNRILLYILSLLLVASFSFSVYTALKIKRLENEFLNPPDREFFMQHKKKPPKNFGLYKRLVKDLDLSPEQQQQFKAIFTDFKQNSRQLRDSIRFYRQMFSAELAKSEPDTAKMIFAAEKLGYFHTQIKLNFVNYFNKLQKILNQEQKEKLARIFAEIEQRKKPRL